MKRAWSKRDVVFNLSLLQCTMPSTFSGGRISDPLKRPLSGKKAKRSTIHLEAFLFRECQIEFHGLVVHVKWPRFVLWRWAQSKISRGGVAFRKARLPLVISSLRYSFYHREAFKWWDWAPKERIEKWPFGEEDITCPMNKYLHSHRFKINKANYWHLDDKEDCWHKAKSIILQNFL